MERNKAVEYLDAYFKKLSKKLPNGVVFNKQNTATNKNAITCFDIVDNEFCIQLALPNAYFDAECMDFDDETFIACILDFTHEAYHVMQVSQSWDAAHKPDELKSYVTRCGNNKIYESLYNLFTYEVAAERYVVKNTADYIIRHLGDTKYMGSLRSIISRKSEKQTAPYSYFIVVDNNDSIRDVLRKFDIAYDRSLNDKKFFENVRDGLLYVDLQTNVDLMNKLIHAGTGREETNIIANHMIEEHSDLFPELSKQAVRVFKISRRSFTTISFNDIRNVRVAEVDILDTEDDSDVSRTDPTDDWL